jgi:hypothetical protein
MKRDRPADDMRRWAINARLLGMSTREIALRLGRSPNTIKRYLCSCGGVIDGRYHLNRLAAMALFTEDELLQLGAVWNGHCWVGPGRDASET